VYESRTEIPKVDMDLAVGQSSLVYRFIRTPLFSRIGRRMRLSGQPWRIALAHR
jgi:hypothetical protein